MAGVSQTTVSLILNNRTDVTFPESTRQKVLEAARKLNYVPNQFARGLKTKRSRLIGLILPTISNPYYQMLAQYVEEATAHYGYNLLLCNTSRLAEREAFYLNLLSGKFADGVIYALEPFMPEKAKQLFGPERIVVIGDANPELGMPNVSLNSFQAGRLVARHLLELGHERIGFITSPFTGYTSSRRKRMEGVIAAMREAGLEHQLVIKEGEHERENFDGSYEIDIGFSLTEALLRENEVTAVIGVNDMVAFGALSYITRTNMRIPDEISVCGFDNIYLSRSLRPHITTVDHQLNEKVRLAVRMIVANAGDGGDEAAAAEEEPKGPVLVPRDSTGPAPAKRSMRIV
jgi:LacI family transcriptional regulator